MKINVLEQVRTEIQTYTEEILNEETGELEIVEKQREVPKYGAVTRDMTPQEEQEYNQANVSNEDQINILKNRLQETDYIASKLSEATAIYLCTGSDTKIKEVYKQYKDIITERDNIRKQINQLESM